MSQKFNHLIIYCDGGSRGNPGPSAAGVVVEDLQAKTILTTSKFLGKATNNVAEYSAVITALKLLLEKQIFTDYLEIRLDAKIVASQLAGLYKIKQPHLHQLMMQVRLLESQVAKQVFYKHIQRENNAAADNLVNQELDRVSHQPVRF